MAWPREDRPLSVFVQLDSTLYDRIGASSGLGAGLLRDGKHYGLELSVWGQRERPSFVVGDSFGRADVLALRTEHSVRLPLGLQLAVMAEHQEESFELEPGRDNTLQRAGASLRIRGLGQVFSPQLSAAWGERRATDPVQDYNQQELELKLRSAPTRAFYVSVSYRERRNDYAVLDPAASNFGRQDVRRRLALATGVRAGNHLTWTVYLAREEARSTRPSRDFAATVAGLGFTVRVSESRRDIPAWEPWGSPLGGR